MNPKRERLAALEELLVHEFRTCQALHSLTKEERGALSTRDIDRLLSVVEQKEVSLDELNTLEDRRKMMVGELAQTLGLSLPSPTLADLLDQIDQGIADRLGRLREGILTLLGSVRELTHGNQALATCALERTDAVQAFLLNLFQPATGYQPPGFTPASKPVFSWDIDQRA